MNNIRAIIVDDELRARRVLKNLIHKINPKIDIVAECESLIRAVKTIKSIKPDVVFLDVEMPNYLGYEIVSFFEDIDFEIIFVTAFDKYAIKAFEICAIDYLVKPVNRNRLKDSLGKLVFKINDKNRLEQYQTLLESVSSKEYNKIVIPESGNRRIVDVSKIKAIEANGSYANIHFNDNKKLTVSKNLKYFENTLSFSSSFIRVHRGWLVNLDYVQKMNKTKGVIYMGNNFEAKIVRSCYEDFLNALKKVST